MPNYDYQCTKCGSILTFLGNYKDDVRLDVCNVCITDSKVSGLSVFRRLFSPSTNFILRGNCWGKDNYCKHKDKNKEKEKKDNANKV